MKRVFCKHCKYYHNACAHYPGNCEHKSNLYHKYLATRMVTHYVESVYVKNKNNDCEYYKTKWYLRWFIRGE